MVPRIQKKCWNTKNVPYTQCIATNNNNKGVGNYKLSLVMFQRNYIQVYCYVNNKNTEQY